MYEFTISLGSIWWFLVFMLTIKLTMCLPLPPFFSLTIPKLTIRKRGFWRKSKCMKGWKPHKPSFLEGNDTTVHCHTIPTSCAILPTTHTTSNSLDMGMNKVLSFAHSTVSSTYKIINVAMLWGENREAGSHRELNPGNLWLEHPVLCHWCHWQPDDHQPPL